MWGANLNFLKNSPKKQDITGLAIRKDNLVIACTYGNKLNSFVIQSGDGGEVTTTAEDKIQSLTFLPPEGHIIATGLENGKIVFWDGGNLKKRNEETIQVDKKIIEGKAPMFSPDGKMFVSNVNEGPTSLLRLWRKKGKVWHMDKEIEGRMAAFSPDGNMLMTTKIIVGKSTLVDLWDLKGNKKVDTFNLPQHSIIRLLAFSADNTLLALIPTATGIYRLINIRTKEEIFSMRGGYTALAFSPDGKTFAFSPTDIPGGEMIMMPPIYLIDIKSREIVQELKCDDAPGKEIYQITFSPDGKMIAASCTDGSIRTWKK